MFYSNGKEALYLPWGCGVVGHGCLTDIPAAWLTPGLPCCVSQDVGQVSQRHPPVALKGGQGLDSDGAEALGALQKTWDNPSLGATVLGKVGNPHFSHFPGEDIEAHGCTGAELPEHKAQPVSSTQG